MPSTRARLTDRAAWFAVFGLLDAANQLFASVRKYALDHGAQAVLLDLGGISAIILFALYVVATIGLHERAAEPGKPGDRAVLALMAVAAAVPLAVSASLGLFAGGLYLWLTAASMSRSRRLGMLFLALTGTMLWGKLVLEVVPHPLLELDAFLAGHFAGVPVSGNVVGGADPNQGLVVFPACSSLHNMSLALVMWTSLVCALSLRVTLRHVACGLVAIAAMAFVNICRLAAMVHYPAHFVYLHDGFGATLFAMTSFVLAGLIIGLGFVLVEKSASR